MGQRVATVTLNRPEIHNAFDDVMMKELTEAFGAVGDDQAARVVVLRSEG